MVNDSVKKTLDRSEHDKVILNEVRQYGRKQCGNELVGLGERGVLAAVGDAPKALIDVQVTEVVGYSGT